MTFDDYYEVNKKKVLKQCKKILKIEKKYGRRNVNLIECRMHDYPKFADWSMYRENESSFFENEITHDRHFTVYQNTPKVIFELQRLSATVAK